MHSLDGDTPGAMLKFGDDPTIFVKVVASAARQTLYAWSL